MCDDQLPEHGLKAVRLFQHASLIPLQGKVALVYVELRPVNEE